MKKIFRLFSVMLIIGTLGVALSACGKKDDNLAKSNDKIKSLKVSNSDDTYMSLDVFFDGSKDENEVNVVKEERTIEREELLGEIIMQELIKGPSVESKLKPVLHKDTKLISFSIKDGIAYINLSATAKYKMTAAKEEACLKSILLSLTQLSSIDKVKILVENKNVDTLGGNFDISKPFGLNDLESIKK